MNKENVLKLADHLDKTTAVFDMGISVQCMAARAVYLFEGITRNRLSDLHYDWFEIRNSARQHLDLTESQMFELFAPDFTLSRGSASLKAMRDPKFAAAVLRHFAATGDITWPSRDQLDWQENEHG